VNLVAWEQSELRSKEIWAAFLWQAEATKEIIVLQHADSAKVPAPSATLQGQQTSTFKLFAETWANRFRAILAGLPGSL
jgi:hypothetical protein